MESNKNRQDYEEAWNLDNIKYLILDVPDKYIVFIDDSFYVDWKTSDEFDKKGHNDSPKYNLILSKLAEIESIPNDHLQESVRLNFKRMLGESIARSLEGEYENGEKILEKAREYVQKRNLETGRYWHLISSTIVGLILMLLGLSLWMLRNTLIPFLGSTGFFVLLSTCGGGIGALLSIIGRIGKSRFDSAAGKNLHYLEGALRVIAGSISGTIIALFIYIGLILPAFTDNKYIAMFAFSLVAGASERLVPSIISQLTDKVNENFIVEEGTLHGKTYSSNI